MRLKLLLPALLLVAAGCENKLTCPQGEVDCGGRCVSLLTSADNCGACGNGCGALGVCSAGSCGCAPGVATCDGVCTDLARDPAHCGDCDTACGGEAALCYTDGDATSCTGSCPEGTSACSGACVDTTSDRLHCGACGHACAVGQACRDGACAADIQVACYATGDVRPVTADLSPAGEPRLARGSPTVLAASADMLYTGNGYPAGLGVIPLDDRLPTDLTVLAGDDAEAVTTYANAVLVSNAGQGTLVVLDARGQVLDEIALPGVELDPPRAPNPHGLAVVGSTAYVALYGDGPNGFSGQSTVSGQAVAKVDLSGLPACVADAAPPACGEGSSCDDGRTCREGACRLRCGEVSGTIDLLGVPGTADSTAEEPAYPFPQAVAVRGSKVYVTLSNLAYADLGGGFAGYLKPAGNGKLAVIDSAAGDAVSVVDLGTDCRNPGSLAIDDQTGWVACASMSFPELAPNRIVSVDLGAAQPALGTPVDASAIAPGALAICGGMGYVTDQASGAVLRFDLTTRTAEDPVTVCPTAWFAWASDIACQ
ncbi:MAG: MXAN_6577-like cysteine-rich protein [Anaeromyxobacter sp.]